MRVGARVRVATLAVAALGCCVARWHRCWGTCGTIRSAALEVIIVRDDVVEVGVRLG